jgi:tetratricopeptide (TPR) repeat protein/predicted Ser/Thr protein kinase
VNRDRWRRVRELFEAALERPEETRPAFLATECAGDPELRAEVESLLSVHRSGGSFLEGAAVPLPVEEPPGAIEIPGFRMLGTLGSGGLGVVYLAEQESPRRLVAIKLIRGDVASPPAVRRFEHEPELLALLQHRGIAQVFGSGTVQGRPYFVMERIEGASLTEHARRAGLGVRERLALFARVCEAVQHAHAKGVIHRDLKPANILVDASGQPKVLDFGVARVTDSDLRLTTLRTDVGQLIGTLPYMSPEQASGDPGAVDTRSDVYALGVVLYELLADRLPRDLEGKLLPEAVRLLAESDPVPLRSVKAGLGGELETIVGKALERERERRYQTAAELGADVERWLRDEPIAARPPSALYQLRKFARRNRVLVGGLVAVFLVLVAGVIGTTRGMLAARRASVFAEDRRADAERETRKTGRMLSFVQRMLSGLNPDVARGADVPIIRTMLEKAAAALEADPTKDADEEGALRIILGETYATIGLDREAEAQYRKALDRYRAAGLDRSAAIALNRLGYALTLQGREAEAEEPLEEALEIIRSRPGDPGVRPEDVLVAQVVLAQVYVSLGRLDEAEKIMGEAVLTMEERRADPDDVATTYKNLGLSRMRRGDLVGAQSLYEKALEMRRKLHGEEHTLVADALSCLAALHQQKGDQAGAAALALRALEIQRKLLAPDDPRLYRALANAGSTQILARKFREAERLFREALDQARRAHGPGRAPVGFVLSGLAAALAGLERGDEAEPLFREALAIQRRTLPVTDQTLIETQASLGGLLRSKGDRSGAEALFRAALTGARESLGEQHRITVWLRRAIEDVEQEKAREGAGGRSR